MREASGMTQRDLAAVTGVTQGEISAIEKEKALPGLGIIKKLQRGLDVDFLFFDV